MRNFAITTGRWTGIWAWIWYADVMHESDDVPYTSFNALTRRGALRKATRYIRRLTSPIENKQAFIYAYDQSRFTLEKIDV
jgi:hypothetical protein